MRFFKKTTHTVLPTDGSILNTTHKIIDTETDGTVDSVLDGLARDLQAASHSIYWSFDEKTFKAVHNADDRLVTYVSVQEL